MDHNYNELWNRAAEKSIYDEQKKRDQNNETTSHLNA